MDETPFTPILRDLVRRVPGAYAVALVDSGGETVDYFAVAAEPFDIRVAAAHVQILLRNVDEYGALGQPRWMVIRGVHKSLLARALPDGYALGLLLRRRAGFAASSRAFAACERALAHEAGWSPPRPVGAAKSAPRRQDWYPIDVVADARGRPRKIGTRGAEVEVLGALVGLPRRERGFRVRTASGTELTLVREARRYWYADEPVDEASF